MISPAQVAHRFVKLLLVGAALGLFYGALGPLRRRHPHWADLLFLPPLFYGWLYGSFAICRGDIRVAYTAAMALGAIGWCLTAGRGLAPVFDALWHLAGRICRLLTLPVKKFFIFCG